MAGQNSQHSTVSSYRRPSFGGFPRASMARGFSISRQPRIRAGEHQQDVTHMHESRPSDPLVVKSGGRIDFSVPPEIKEELTAIAFMFGKGLSAYMRDIVIEHVRGRLGLLRMKGVIPVNRDPTSFVRDSED